MEQPMHQPRHIPMPPQVTRGYYRAPYGHSQGHAHCGNTAAPYNFNDISQISPPNQYENHHTRFDLQQQQYLQQQQKFQNQNNYYHHPTQSSYMYTWEPPTPIKTRARASSRSSRGSSTSSRSPILDDQEIEEKHKLGDREFSPLPPPAHVDPEVEEPCNDDSIPRATYRGNGTRNTVPLPHPQDSNRTRRRTNSNANNLNGAETTQTKFRKGGAKQECYVLRMQDDYQVDIPEEETTAISDPLFTLSDGEYREIFTQLGNIFCHTAYRWLALYKFRIPRKKYMREHTCPDDRELTEYVTIIKSLVEGREVPRNAVRDDRLNELISIMEGASEIRHVNIHVSRKKKPDRRVLGFIAAVNEFCWILGDHRGAAETNKLYADTEAKSLENRRKFHEDARRKQIASLPMDTLRRNSTSRSPERRPSSGYPAIA
ncbi:hypothetical protein FPQ18DRAFT_114109 [Pyronema domesticum]|nr:hypothetical protein FPQ18DRAFT_114109 [Pyronema domesticum]